MKLYYKKAACSLVVRIILNAVSVSFEDIEVDLQTKTYQNHQDFKAINPKGSVPTLALDNGDILTENAVILQYLADTFDKNHLLLPVNTFERYRVLEWLNYITTELHKGFSPLFNPNMPENVKIDVVKPLLKTKFRYVDNYLKNHKTLTQDKFTLPDAYLYVMVRWAIGQEIDLSDLTHLIQYVIYLEQHDSIKKSLEQEKLLRIANRLAV